MDERDQLTQEVMLHGGVDLTDTVRVLRVDTDGSVMLCKEDKEQLNRIEDMLQRLLEKP